MNIEFKPPEGSVPDSVRAGETFTLVCDFEVKGNGKVCMVKFGDTDVGYKADKESPHRGPYSKEAEDMASQPMTSDMNPGTKGESY